MNLEQLCIVGIVIGLIVLVSVAGYSAFLPPLEDDDHLEGNSHD